MRGNPAAWIVAPDCWVAHKDKGGVPGADHLTWAGCDAEAIERLTHSREIRETADFPR